MRFPKCQFTTNFVNKQRIYDRHSTYEVLWLFEIWHFFFVSHLRYMIFIREQLIAGAVLGEVFLLFFFSTFPIALKLCIMYDILYNKSCQNRFLKFTQCSALLRICWVCWESPKFTRIIGYWLNIDSLSIHRFLVQKTLAN